MLCLCNLLKYSVVKPVCVYTCCLANNYHILSAVFLLCVSFMFLSFHLPFCSYSCGSILCLWSWAASSMDCCLAGSLLLQINWLIKKSRCSGQHAYRPCLIRFSCSLHEECASAFQHCMKDIVSWVLRCCLNDDVTWQGRRWLLACSAGRYRHCMTCHAIQHHQTMPRSYNVRQCMFSMHSAPVCQTDWRTDTERISISPRSA